jgi:hypothetical protein
MQEVNVFVDIAEGVGYNEEKILAEKGEPT